MIGRNGERGSGISALAVRHDDDDDDRLYVHVNQVFYTKVLIHGTFNRDIGPAVRVFANGPGDLGSIPGRVIPKTLKMELDTTLLDTQHYKVRFKGKVEQSREWSSALPYTLV